MVCRILVYVVFWAAIMGWGEAQLSEGHYPQQESKQGWVAVKEHKFS